MTQEDISEVTGIRDWYYEVLKKYNVTTAGLMREIWQKPYLFK